MPVDVHIIAATHKDLKTLTETGAFRADLFYRERAVLRAFTFARPSQGHH